MTIVNPYRDGATAWRRGNLHAHTTLSDGERAPQALIDRYAELGYDFLAISDHDMIADTSALDARRMTLVPANEVTINGPHVVHVGARSVVPPHADRQRVIDGIRADGGAAIMAHPNWERHFNHCPQDRLEAWQGYTGVEIYNGLVRAHEGNPLATDRWDMLLSKGRRVWGFANDDAHFAGDEGVAWNMVQSDATDPASIVEAMRTGRFYASTGVTIESIRVRGTVFSIRTRDAQRIAVYADHGRRIAQKDSVAIDFALSSHVDCTYVRFECFGPCESMAWTQPFFITP
ncbi:MAG: phosphoesterase [Candidatus Hydrogenedentes bacterium]|nr:phosphoesterase [Candidatus Hydrogenedentota bacterium]